LLTQIKKLKHDKKSLQEELDRKTSSVDKETNTDPTELPETLKVEEGSNKQDSEEIRVPYHHPNHKTHYDQRQGQGEYKQCSYRQLNYNIEKKTKTKSTTCMEAKTRNHIRAINHQTVPMKVDLGWITPQKMRHISL
jgi:hypothetical protein